MKAKTLIESSEVVEFIRDAWMVYATSPCRGGRLIFTVGLGAPLFRVKLGDTLLYYGDDIEDAVNAWNEA